MHFKNLAGVSWAGWFFLSIDGFAGFTVVTKQLPVDRLDGYVESVIICFCWRR